MTAPATLRLLIAAMGGEGGGVLAGWIVEAATAEGLWVQRTSIPGVAQRTGATTYYIEMAPPGGTRPVMALNPAPGEVDVLVATELLEAARMVQAGYVTPDRTLVVGSTHRVYTMAEKTAGGDGRLDGTALRSQVERFSRHAVLADIAAAAQDAGAQANAVVLGMLAATGVLPVPATALRRAIEAEGRAVAGNIRGFEAGLAVVPGSAPAPAATQAAGAAEIVAAGVARLTDYQDAGYAQLYRDRLAPFEGRLAIDSFAELARQLALRMSYEDTIRVAQLKLAESRLARVAAEARARPGDIVDITEYFKPGPEEILSLLPPSLGRRALAAVEARGWGRLAMPMKIRTTRLSGFLKLRLLAGLRFWRPRSLRHAEEQRWIVDWLALVDRVQAVDAAAAREVIEAAALLRGYGDTWKRGRENWRLLVDGIVEPMLAGRLPRRHFADAVMQARLAATADPEGDRLVQVIAGVERLGQKTVAA